MSFGQVPWQETAGLAGSGPWGRGQALLSVFQAGEPQDQVTFSWGAWPGLPTGEHQQRAEFQRRGGRASESFPKGGFGYRSEVG